MRSCCAALSFGVAAGLVLLVVAYRISEQFDKQIFPL